MMSPPPNQLVYRDKQKFMLRAHIYQARSLIGSDASGLSGETFLFPFSFVLKKYKCLSHQSHYKLGAARQYQSVYDTYYHNHYLF